MIHDLMVSKANLLKISDTETLVTVEVESPPFLLFSYFEPVIHEDERKKATRWET